MQCGKATFASIHSASSGSAMRAWASTAVRAMFPFPGRLSQDITVNGGTPRSRLRARAWTMKPKAV